MDIKIPVFVVDKNTLADDIEIVATEGQMNDLVEVARNIRPFSIQVLIGDTFVANLSESHTDENTIIIRTPHSALGKFEGVTRVGEVTYREVGVCQVTLI